MQQLDVAFYGPMKRAWRKILDNWKASGRKVTRTLSKDAFPKLLNKLEVAMGSISTNLQSVFKKCGIYPFQPQKVLEQLPDSEERVQGVDLTVSESVLGMLKAMRGVDGESQPKKRRKKVNVEPGKSITVEDLATAGK